MRAEVQLFEKSGTISLNWIKNMNIQTRIYKNLWKDNLWFLIFQKAEFRQAFFTTIMGPIWLTQKPFGWFSTLIPRQSTVLRNSIVLRYFSLREYWEQFCWFHSTGYVYGAENLCIGVIFYAESRDQKSFSKLENFTLSRSKVWNLPMCSQNFLEIGPESRY